jgi:phosphate-selective porin OprO/OprP
VFSQHHSLRPSSVRITAAVLLFSLIFVSGIHAQDAEITLQKLREQVEEQSRRLDQLEADNAASISRLNVSENEDFQSIESRLSSLESESAETLAAASEFLESPSTESLRRSTGRLHLDYWGFPQASGGINRIETGDPLNSVNDRFELRRIRLGVRGSVPPQNVSYQLDLEFAGVDQIGIRDAWIGIDDLGIFDTVRVGNQKRPYALAQLNSSNFTVFIERPYVAEAVNDPNRRFGIQSFGVSDDQRLNWRYGVFNLVPIDEFGFISSNSYQTEVAGRIASTAWHDRSTIDECYLHLGISSSFAFPSQNSEKTTARFRSRPEARSINRWLDTGFIGSTQSYQLLGTESVLNVGSLQMGAEYIHLWSQRGDGFNDLYFHGGYVYLSHFLTGEYIPWNRVMGILGRVEPFRDVIGNNRSCTSGCGAWQWAVRGSFADFNDENINGGRAAGFTVALNWYWNSHTRLQFNYLAGDISDRAVASSTAPSELVSGDYQILGSRFMIDY